MRESFGADGQPSSYTDMDHTDCLLIIGHNVSTTQTLLWTRIVDRLAGPDLPKLIVIDPRRSDTAKKATVHLAPRTGTNMAVLKDIQHLLFRTVGLTMSGVRSSFEQLREKVDKYNPQYVEYITGKLTL